MAHRRQGTATIEYACILGVLAAVLVVAVPTMSLTVQSSMRTVEVAMVQEEAAAETPSPPEQFSPPATVAARKFYIVQIVLLIIIACFAMFAVHQHRSAVRQLDAGEQALQETIAAHSVNLLEKRQKIQVAVSTHWHNASSSELVAAELMTSSLETIGPETARAELESLFKRTGLHHLLVTSNEQLLGVVSDRDLRDRPGHVAEEVMTKGAITVHPTASISRTINKMLTHRISCIPVVDGKILCGIVTMSDIAMGLQCTLRALDQIAVVLQESTDGEFSQEGVRDSHRTDVLQPC